MTELAGGVLRILTVSQAVHGVPRATGDLDIWAEPTPANAQRVWAALEEFGAPLESLDLSAADLEALDRVIQIGLPLRRIDLLTTISGVAFEAGWKTRVVHPIEGVDIAFLGREELVRNKRASGRYQDVADLEAIGEIPDQV